MLKLSEQKKIKTVLKNTLKTIFALAVAVLLKLLLLEVPTASSNICVHIAAGSQIHFSTFNDSIPR